MAPRKLNKQQRNRIRAAQEKTILDSQDSDQESVDTKTSTGLVIQHHGKNAIVESADGELLDCGVRQNLGAIVCGDEVIYQQSAHSTQAVILAVKERRNVLVRPDFRRKPKPFAANIDQIIIVTATVPEISHHLLDRYLVVVENIGLKAYIIVNKTDLVSENEMNAIRATMKVYQRLGYPLIYTSTKTDHGLDELKQAVINNSNILVGQSGVGKSSIINHLIPELEVQVGELSQANHGKHTTSSSTLYRLPDGGRIIDSPGVRDFGVWHIESEQITAGFVEFHPYQGQCRFHNCQHLHEPGCAVKEAVDEGKIAVERLQSYQQMLNENEAG